MSYKTIIVHAEKSRHAKQVIALAASVAAQEEAHLDALREILLGGVSRTLLQSMTVPVLMSA